MIIRIRDIIRDISLERKLDLLVAAACLVFALAVLPALFLLFYLVLDRHELSRLSSKQLYLALSLTLFLLSGALCLFGKFRQLILGPLHNLASLMNRAAGEDGNKAAGSGHGGEDKIALLVDSCNRLLDRIERSERDKERLIRDLHDGLGGIMTNIKLTAAIALRSEAVSGGRQSLAVIEELAQEGITEIGRFISCVDNFPTNWRLLTAEMRRYAHTMLDGNRIGFSMNFSADDRTPVLDPVFTLQLWRIYSEALSNILKHARAGNVAVNLHFRHQGLVMEIIDDGNGIGDHPGRSGGTANMEKRAAAMGGSLLIRANTGGGTRVILEVPFSPFRPRRDRGPDEDSNYRG